jgi:hypothetical protein
MRSDRIQCGFESRPGYSSPDDGRVAQRKCNRFISGRREVRLLPRPHHARLAQLAEATCSNQVRSEFESPGAHETSRAEGDRLPIEMGRSRVRVPPGESP